MQKRTEEFIKAQEMFEHIYKHNRLDKKNTDVPGVFYCDGVVNKLFVAFLHGCEFSKYTNDEKLILALKTAVETIEDMQNVPSINDINRWKALINQDKYRPF